MSKCEYCQIPLANPGTRLVGGKFACHVCAEELIAKAKAVKHPINGHCPRCGAPVYGPTEALAFAPSYCSGDSYYPMNLVSYGCSCRYHPAVNVVQLDDKQMEELKTHLTINLAPKPEPKKGWW